ncbi:KH domain-containing RNA-binding protein QKI-like isoform X2 [Ptychodera flava]|uniref:KH domain-containing RNA-binding protein QKI-like isoform X2 n=1 Tax=Ptychodera flava TaxID=63121 RepID=UPI00396A0FD2
MSTIGLEKEKESPMSAGSTPEYLAQLLKDKKALATLPNLFAHVERLLEEEISRVRATLFPVLGVQDKLPDPAGPVVQLSEKLYVPVKEYPDYNFVGRILGPRGKTAQELERLTGCKIMVRGKGSMRDKKKEEQNRGKPNWEHLNEELHVLITVEDSKERAEIKLARAVNEIKRLLVPAAEGEDNLKKGQLMELAILRGTFRENTPNNTNLKAMHPELFYMENCFLPDVPTSMVPPTTTVLPQALRSPTPAVHPHLISSQLMPRMANGQALLANGLPHGTLLPHEAALAYPHYETYPYAMPALLEYPVEATATVGAVPKARRFVRDHPYQRAVLERAATGN